MRRVRKRSPRAVLSHLSLTGEPRFYSKLRRRAMIQHLRLVFATPRREDPPLRAALRAARSRSSAAPRRYARFTARPQTAGRCTTATRAASAHRPPRPASHRPLLAVEWSLRCPTLACRTMPSLRQARTLPSSAILRCTTARRGASTTSARAAPPREEWWRCHRVRCGRKAVVRGVGRQAVVVTRKTPRKRRSERKSALAACVCGGAADEPAGSSRLPPCSGSCLKKDFPTKARPRRSFGN